MLSPPYLHPLLTSSLPIDVLVHLSAGWHLQVSLGGLWVFSLWHAARSPTTPVSLGRAPGLQWLLAGFYVKQNTNTMCSLSLYLNNSPPPNDSSALSPALKVAAALSAIIRYCKHCQWISLFLTMSTGFNYQWMSRMPPGSTSFLSEPDPFLVLCNIVRHCPNALINILHTQHLWSVFHCSSSGETSVAALQMDIGASPETIRSPHTTPHRSHAF